MISFLKEINKRPIHVLPYYLQEITVKPKQRPYITIILSLILGGFLAYGCAQRSSEQIAMDRKAFLIQEADLKLKILAKSNQLKRLTADPLLAGQIQRTLKADVTKINEVYKTYKENNDAYLKASHNSPVESLHDTPDHSFPPDFFNKIALQTKLVRGQYLKKFRLQTFSGTGRIIDISKRKKIGAYVVKILAVNSAPIREAGLVDVVVYILRTNDPKLLLSSQKFDDVKFEATMISLKSAARDGVFTLVSRGFVNSVEKLGALGGTGGGSALVPPQTDPAVGKKGKTKKGNKAYKPKKKSSSKTTKKSQPTSQPKFNQPNAGSTGGDEEWED